MPATTLDALVTKNKGNALKALKGGVLVAPMSAVLPTALTALSTDTTPAPQLQSLTGFSSLGLISDAGAVLAPSVTSSPIQAWGEAYPVRTDITSKTTTLQIVALESSKAVLSTYYGVDPASVVPDPSTGEVVLTDLGDLSTTYYRVLVLGQDGAAGSEKWIAHLLPNANITNFGNMTLMSGADSIQYDMTFTAYKDDTAGFAKKTFLAGPGWLAGQAAAGFGA